MQSAIDMEPEQPREMNIFFYRRNPTPRLTHGRLSRARDLFSKSHRYRASTGRALRKRLHCGESMPRCVRPNSAIPKQARWQSIEAALALTSSRQVKILAGLAMARSGDSTRAGNFADDLFKSFALRLDGQLLIGCRRFALLWNWGAKIRQRPLTLLQEASQV